MHRLREAAARERRFPILWWLFLMVLTGGMFFVVVYHTSPPAAWLVGVLLLAAWAAPILALQSMTPPRRPATPVPPPGLGSFSDWKKQARLIGRMIIYYEENRDIPQDLRRALGRAAHDLRDTLRSHPLRDDLERICSRVREETFQQMKDWLWRNNSRYVRTVQNHYAKALHGAASEDERLVLLQNAVEDAAAEMARQCMPRLLERERLMCARDCAWLATQTVGGMTGKISPIALAAALVVEWSDFSEPWQPARMLHRATARLDLTPAVAMESESSLSGEPASASAATGTQTEKFVIRNGRRYRRVRVRRSGRRRSRRARGPTLLNILLSFGQWVRYSVRSWMLYR